MVRIVHIFMMFVKIKYLMVDYFVFIFVRFIKFYYILLLEDLLKKSMLIEESWFRFQCYQTKNQNRNMS